MRHLCDGPWIVKMVRPGRIVHYRLLWKHNVTRLNLLGVARRKIVCHNQPTKQQLYDRWLEACRNQRIAYDAPCEL